MNVENKGKKRNSMRKTAEIVLTFGKIWNSRRKTRWLVRFSSACCSACFHRLEKRLRKTKNTRSIRLLVYFSPEGESGFPFLFQPPFHGFPRSFPLKNTGKSWVFLIFHNFRSVFNVVFHNPALSKAFTVGKRAPAVVFRPGKPTARLENLYIVLKNGEYQRVALFRVFRRGEKKNGL